MLVKIESNYTLDEISELYACLVTSGVLSQHDVDQLADDFSKYEAGYYQLDFLCINNLLLPFADRFVGYEKQERKLARYDNNTDRFYRNLTLRLLHGSPLRQHAPTCTINSTTGELTMRAGQHATSFNFSIHPEYLVQVTTHLNRLLQQHGADVAYHEIAFDEDTIFLLLTAWQFNYLVTNRVLDFRRIDYPEVEAWRKTIRREDLPF
jgi:hypothetical protein